MLLHEGSRIDFSSGPLKAAVIDEHLGTGGFASVWRIRDIESDRLFVLKHIRVKPDIVDKEKFIQRIKNEASISIPSPYIAQVLGFISLDENNYGILFEYIKGVSLGDWITANHSASWTRKKELFIKILKGVGHAHALNIIHRDLKPANVLVTEDDSPRIIDFGLAKFKDKSITVTGEFAGTLPYCDPEVLLNGIKYVDARCDIYALGVTLHEFIRGINFWTLLGLDFGEFVGHLKEGKRHILEIDNSFSFPESPSIENIIAACTLFDSEHRVPTINDLVKILGGVPDVRPEYSIDFTLSSPVLVVEDGSAKGAMNILTILDGGEKKLGRMNLDATNNTISREHAAIVRNGNQYFLYDSDSSNGTFLNGSKLEPGRENLIEIQHMDRVRFGDLWTRFAFLSR